MNALFLKDLARKTLRGLGGKIEACKSGGGNAFGYTVVRRFGADGTINAGNRAITQDVALACDEGCGPAGIAQSAGDPRQG
jgi:site-specific DNA recombinase